MDSMDVFLYGIFAKAKAMDVPDDSFSPKEKVSGKEEVIGTLSDELKKLSIVIHDYRVTLNAKKEFMLALAKKVAFDKATGEEITIYREYSLEYGRLSVLYAIFLQMVRESLFDAETAVINPAINFRENWQVVRLPPALAFGIIMGCPHNPGD